MTIRRPASGRASSAANASPRHTQQTFGPSTQQFLCYLMRQRLRIVRRPGARRAKLITPIWSEHARIHDKFAPFDSRPNSDRHLAAAFEPSQDRALRLDGHARLGMI